jgi:hypothetical protein
MKRVLTTNPRSGTHYLKALIAFILGEPPLEKEFATADELRAAISSVADTQLIYGHFHYSQFISVLNPVELPDLRIVILTRHPLDRLISELAFARASGARLPDSARTPQQLARELVLGQWDCKPWEDGFIVTDYAAIHNFYLRELVTNWLELRCCHLVKFEDLVADPFAVLMTCLDFLEISASASDIRDAIGEITFTSLSDGRRPGQADPMSHYRNGMPGEWLRVFTEEDARLLRSKYGAEFRQAGYIL